MHRPSTPNLEKLSHEYFCLKEQILEKLQRAAFPETAPGFHASKSRSCLRYMPRLQSEEEEQTKLTTPESRKTHQEESLMRRL